MPLTLPSLVCLPALCCGDLGRDCDSLQCRLWRTAAGQPELLSAVPQGVVLIRAQCRPLPVVLGRADHHTQGAVVVQCLHRRLWPQQSYYKPPHVRALWPERVLLGQHGRKPMQTLLSKVRIYRTRAVLDGGGGVLK